MTHEHRDHLSRVAALVRLARAVDSRAFEALLADVRARAREGARVRLSVVCQQEAAYWRRFIECELRLPLDAAEEVPF